MKGLIDIEDAGAWAVGMEKRRRKRSSMVRYSWTVPAGSKLWLCANSLGGLGYPISTFPDGSGFGNNAVQAVGAKQPTLQSVTWARQTFNVARFDTVDDGLVSPLIVPSGTPYSVFALWRPATVGISSCFFGSTIRSFTWGAYNGLLRLYCNSAGATTGVSNADYVLVEMRSEAGGLQAGSVYLNGWPVQIGAGSWAPGAGPIAIGATCFDGYPGACDLAELIVYDRLLTNADAVQVRRYFQSVYNFMKV